jgi:hypothetical protein
VVHQLAYQPARQGTGDDERKGSGYRGCYQSEHVTCFLPLVGNFIFLRDCRFTIGFPGDEHTVFNLQQALTHHTMKRGARLLAFELVIEYQCNQVAHVIISL